MSSTGRQPHLLVAAMSLAQAAGMVAIVAFPALVPLFQSTWALSNLEIGWISGAYFAGYVVAVPLATTLTDRRDPRRIVLWGMAVSAIGIAGFAVAADGVWTAALWRFVQGMGLACIYMPGLRALSDAVPEPMQGRAVAFFSASFSVGNAASFFLAGELAAAFGWQIGLGLLALGPLAGAALIGAFLPPRHVRHRTAATPLFNVRPVLANRPALAYVLAYVVHNAESSSVRTFAVALLAANQAHQVAAAAGTAWSPTTIVAAANLLGLPAIVLGNELARRYGRLRVLTLVATSSAAVGLALGAASTAPTALLVALLLLYGIAVPADVGAINAGVVAAATPEHRGATLAVHALLGFVGAVASPVLFGGVLDLAGGGAAQTAWIAAFLVQAGIVALGPLALLALDRGRPGT
ncbi:MAG: MFS transporter [Chloroflexi bacterium]|nr:MFS transporter [Chloroflexota bacterium]